MRYLRQIPSSNLNENIALSYYARQFTLTVHFPTEMYLWAPVNIILWCSLAMSQHFIQAGVEIILEVILKYGIRAIFWSARDVDTLIFFVSYDMTVEESSIRRFFAPQALDSLRHSLHRADIVLDQVAPNLPRWLGETANVAGGGAKGLSDRFVSGFL